MPGEPATARPGRPNMLVSGSATSTRASPRLPRGSASGTALTGRPSDGYLTDVHPVRARYGHSAPERRAPWRAGRPAARRVHGRSAGRITCKRSCEFAGPPSPAAGRPTARRELRGVPGSARAAVRWRSNWARSRPMRSGQRSISTFGIRWRPREKSPPVRLRKPRPAHLGSPAHRIRQSSLGPTPGGAQNPPGAGSVAARTPSQGLRAG